MSGIAVAGLLPGLMFGLVAGVVADRVNRRALVLAMDIVRAVLLIGLVVVIATGHATIWLVYVVAFVSGLASVLRDTTAGTLLPSIVAKDQLDRANGRMVTAEIAGNEFAGPPLGGYLFGVAVALPFAVDGGTLAIAAALMASIPVMVQPIAPMGAVRGQSWITDLRAGFGWLRRQRELLAVQVTGVALAMTDSAWFTLLVLYLRDVLGLPGFWFGIMLAIGAVGGLTGGLLAARIVRAVGMRSTIAASLLIAAAGQLALGLTSDVAVTAIVLATSSLVFAVWNVATRTLIQRRTPPELRGRISSINSTVIITASILGAVLGGIVAQQLGLHALFLFGVPLLLVATSVGWWALRARR